MGLISAELAEKGSYDVIVVGSGGAGGQTAYALAMEGVKVLMLEAGRNYAPEVETPMFQTPEQAPLRGAATLDKPVGFYDATVDGGWEIAGEPYSNASPAMERKFQWWRSRMLGGRTNHWARFAFRNGPYDFKPRSRDGLGFDWPVSYEELAPYYDKVERLIGVYGANDGLENTPNSSPGVLLPPPAPRLNERLVQKHARRFGMPVVAAHRAVLTRRLDAKRLPGVLHPGNATAQRLRESMERRAACLWATPCGRGCSIRANYQSGTVHLPPALASGNLDIVTNAMVREVVIGRDGLARGVRFIDKETGRDCRARGRVVALAASACESARLLLNSKFPNSSGLVGKYIMDTVGSTVIGQVPVLENVPPHNEDGADVGHLYAPWWLYREQLAGKLGFARGYHVEFGGGRWMPGVSLFDGIEWVTGGSYGARFKEDLRRYYGSFIFFSGRGEMIPNEQSYCEIDPALKDRSGIPVLRFHWKWSEHETRQAAHMQKTFGALVEAMGGRVRGGVQSDGRLAIAAPGSIIHEVGGAIMGADARKSVTNQYGQTWDVKNLFITDGAVFASNADKNPTLTIMALAWRAADYMVDRMRRKEL